MLTFTYSGKFGKSTVRAENPIKAVATLKRRLRAVTSNHIINNLYVLGKGRDYMEV